ncbi:MAG: DUF2203 domain-containing protein [Planctomycetota bacterium]
MTNRQISTVEASEPVHAFTVAEANAMLPLVRAITGDLVRLSREVIERHERVEHLKIGRKVLPGDPYHDELAQIEEELDKDRQRLNGYVEELRQLGVEPKSGVEGIVDFPGKLDGELIYLCWKLGEPELKYWHPVDAGFADREPLTTAPVPQSCDAEPSS